MNLKRNKYYDDILNEIQKYNQLVPHALKKRRET